VYELFLLFMVEFLVYQLYRMDGYAKYRPKGPTRQAHGHGPSPQLFEDISQAYPQNFYAAGKTFGFIIILLIFALVNE
jgi:hypothetical protein